MPQPTRTRAARVSKRYDADQWQQPALADAPLPDRRGSQALIRLVLALAFVGAIAWAQRASDRPAHSAHLRIVVRQADTGQATPARIYLFKGDRPFRLSPVDVQLPLRVDLFYRERLWRLGTAPKTLEVTARDQSHFILLEGEAEFFLPASSDYRIEAYRGFGQKPAVREFALETDKEQIVELTLEPVAASRQWIAADDHIHLVRQPEDDAVFLKWLEAEDLAVGNFLELQRQQHAAMQYGFGDAAEARAPGRSIRSGHESRSRFYGHILALGASEMIQPLSIGLEYANSPEAWPTPGVIFRRARELGGLAGFAHFYGSQPNSSLLMNLAHGELDFIELFQFGELKTEEWYELLNAGFRVTGLAGSDFPANIGRLDPWPRSIPLLGPERALVRGEPGESAYKTWADGVRRGAVTLTNGPLLELSFESGEGPGAIVDWAGDGRMIRGRAVASWHRPIDVVELVVNGSVVARKQAEGGAESIEMDFQTSIEGSAWIAARAQAPGLPGEPAIRAHTNPAYFLHDGEPPYRREARAALATRWKTEAQYYRESPLVFSSPERRQELLDRVAATEQMLAAPPKHWRRN